jgi:hypothetical protein
MDSHLPSLPCTYYPKPTQLIKVGVISLPFIAGGLFLMHTGWRGTEGFITGFVGLLCLLLGAAGIALVILRLKTPKPLFTIAPDGLHFGGKTPSIRWEEIDSFAVTQVNGQRFVGVFLHDVDGYMNRLNGITLAAAQGSMKFAGTPLNLHARLAGLDDVTLIGWLNHYKQHYSASNAL